MRSQQIDPPTSQLSVGLTSPLRRRDAAQILTAVGAGAAIGVMLVLVMLSFASLIYPASIDGVLARGTGITLLGAAVLTCLSALGSGFHAAVVCPRSHRDPGRCRSGKRRPALGATSTTVFATIAATVIISGVITGVSLFALGRPQTRWPGPLPALSSDRRFLTGCPVSPWPLRRPDTLMTGHQAVLTRMEQANEAFGQLYRLTVQFTEMQRKRQLG